MVKLNVFNVPWNVQSVADIAIPRTIQTRSGAKVKGSPDVCPVQVLDLVEVLFIHIALTVISAEGPLIQRTA